MLLLLLTSVVPTEEECSEREVEAATARAYAIRECDGSVFLGAGASFVVGRADMQWERDETANYTSISIAAPPRYVSWHEDEHGCAMEFGIAGARREECAASPPAPILP